jgi:hypothetical protein
MERSSFAGFTAFRLSECRVARTSKPGPDADAMPRRLLFSWRFTTRERIKSPAVCSGGVVHVFFWGSRRNQISASRTADRVALCGGIDLRGRGEHGVLRCVREITWPTRVPSRKNTRVVHRHSGLLTWLPRRDTAPSKTGRKAVLPFGTRRALPNLLQPQRTPGTQARLRPGPGRSVGHPPSERAGSHPGSLHQSQQLARPGEEPNCTVQCVEVEWD